MKQLAAIFAPLVFACLALLLSPCTATAQEGRWLRAESPHFIIYSERSERATREALGDLEEFDALLRNMFGVQGDLIGQKLEVYLYNSRSSFERMYGNTRTVAGVYIATTETVSAHALFRDGGGVDALDILFHEYTHHFMFQHAWSSYPPWVVEGFAEFYATVAIEDQRIIIGQYSDARASWLINAPWLPLDELLTARIADLNADERARFYAMSWALMHYCRTDPDRWRALIAYLDAVRSGQEPVAAFVERFGALRQVQQDLRAYLARRLPGYAAPRFLQARTPSIEFTRLPASADQLLALDLRMRAERARGEDNTALLDEIRRLSGRYVDDSYAMLVRARAEIMLGNPADGRALLEPMLAASPENADALYLMGLSHVNDARAGREIEHSYTTSRRYFARVFRHNPEHAPTLFHYGQSHFAAPGPMSREALNVLVTARNLAPQVDEIGLMTARALMEVERFDEAAGLLRPIATDPHGGLAADYARQLLEAAERREANPALAAPARADSRAD